MRICVLQSSYEGTGSIFEANDTMPNPGLYIDNSYHQVEQRYVRKFAEKDDIDSFCAENFDMYMNFMWGQLNDNLAGVGATRYLESKRVPVVLSPSNFIAKTKLDFQKAAECGTFNVPSNTPGKYPKIVKYVDGLASIGMDYSSVCYSKEEIDCKVSLLEKAEPNREVLVQDFIRGIESTAIIVEMGSKVYALAPVDWIFDPETPPDKAWLTYSNKFEALGQGSIHFEFVKDEPRRSQLSNAAVAAFKALGMQGQGAWGRADMRCEEATGNVYCLEVNHMPALFYPMDDKLSDDIIIRETYPGGHEAFLEMLLFTKKYQMSLAKFIQCNGSNGSNGTNGINGHSASSDVPAAREEIGDFKAKGTTIAAVYDSAVKNYDAVQEKVDIRAWQIQHFASHDYSGTVLDLACGTGGIGMVIHQTNPTSKISGTDLSPLSLQTAQVKQHYTPPLSVGYLQYEIMKCADKSFDHVTCFGALHFLDRTDFMATVSRMFMVARKSVSFDVDDVSVEYVDAILQCFGEGLRNHNNIRAIDRFGTPKGWKKVIDDYIPLFFSPSVHTDVSGRVMYFEKL